MNTVRLFVSNLPANTHFKEVKELFSKYGKVTDAYVPMDRATRKPKNIAFIEMSTTEESEKARNGLNKYTFKGSKIYVDPAKDREEARSSNNNPRVQSSRFTKAPRRSFGKYIDPALFVKKASAEIQETEEVKKTNTKFADLNLHDILKRNLEDLKYVNPTPIQEQAIPNIIEGKDIIGIANTGTGKTGAFLLPILHNMLNRKERSRVLILAPTRELASQIKDELNLFSKGTRINSVLCIGGTNINNQIMKLRSNPEFVIGTPGRLMDLNRNRKLNFSIFSFVILDEVDRMLDMGFIDEIKDIMSALPSTRQSLFFSATMDPKIKKLAESFLKNPVNVSVKTQETSKNIDQDIVNVRGKEKIEVLHELLIKEELKKVLIFGQTKRSVEKLSQELTKRGFKSNAIHGDKTQFRRQDALNKFKKDFINILVATDVAARGLDISDVTHVINYDVPQSYEDYVHRIGRTGRANKKGYAITFVEK